MIELIGWLLVLLLACIYLAVIVVLLATGVAFVWTLILCVVGQIRHRNWRVYLV